ncbi:hypothetical protein D1872_258730 [compost metagenome]
MYTPRLILRSMNLKPVIRSLDLKKLLAIFQMSGKKRFAISTNAALSVLVLRLPPATFSLVKLLLKV